MNFKLFANVSLKSAIHRIGCSLLLGFACCAPLFGHEEEMAFKKEYPLYQGLDSYEMKISSPSEKAQEYFTQGLMLYYGYNYPEAARAFRAASLLDPGSGICSWGTCLSFCDCIDNPGDKWHKEALEAMQASLSATGKATEKEKDLIQALAARFEKSDKDNSPTTVFADNMRKLYHKYPDDPDIIAIYANVSLKAVDLYDGLRDENPEGSAEDVIEALNKATEKYPFHPGLNHFYIHAMEAAGTPKKALGAAIRLDKSVPGSGHLQHMPAHIYLLYGFYHQATRANQSGIDADNEMFKLGGIKDPEFAGFYLHNYYFLFDSLMLEGRAEEAIDASQKLLQRLVDKDLPSNPYLIDVFTAVPPLLMARAGKWDRISDVQAPPDSYVFATGMRAYALGLAAVRKGDKEEAEKELEVLNRSIANYAEAKKNKGPYSASLAKVQQIASLDLGGQIDALSGDRQKQIDALYKALAIEDTLDFHMLTWYQFMRHALGDALLAANFPGQAEEVFRQDLKKHPRNGWALFGLIKSLEAQQKMEEADHLRPEFEQAWKYADLNLTSSRF